MLVLVINFIWLMMKKNSIIKFFEKKSNGKKLGVSVTLTKPSIQQTDSSSIFRVTPDDKFYSEQILKSNIQNCWIINIKKPNKYLDVLNKFFTIKDNTHAQIKIFFEHIYVQTGSSETNILAQNDLNKTVSSFVHILCNKIFNFNITGECWIYFVNNTVDINIISELFYAIIEARNNDLVIQDPNNINIFHGHKKPLTKPPVEDCGNDSFIIKEDCGNDSSKIKEDCGNDSFIIKEDCGNDGSKIKRKNIKIVKNNQPLDISFILKTSTKYVLYYLSENGSAMSENVLSMNELDTNTKIFKFKDSTEKIIFKKKDKMYGRLQNRMRSTNNNTILLVDCYVSEIKCFITIYCDVKPTFFHKIDVQHSVDDIVKHCNQTKNLNYPMSCILSYLSNKYIYLIVGNARIYFHSKVTDDKFEKCSKHSKNDDCMIQLGLTGW